MPRNINKLAIACLLIFFASSPNTASAGNDSYIGMKREDLLKIYTSGNIKEYKKKDNKEVVVFDDILTSKPDDTITFYLIDGKVRAWDKRKIKFPDEGELKSAVLTGMTKENLLNIYYPGNLIEYKKTGNEEILVFDDILTSDPDDTITFYLIDGKVSSLDKKKYALSPEMRLKAVQERTSYAASHKSYPSSSDNLMAAKQQNRSSSVSLRRDSWYYRNGLHY